MNPLKVVFSLIFIFLFQNSYSQKEALIWKKYKGEITDPSVPKLFNYSYAGYKLANESIPENFPELKRFNVIDYGAIPNDTISDQEAIQKAIMKDHMLRSYPNQPEWLVNYMFKFFPKTDKIDLKAKVISATESNQNYISVDNATAFKGIKYVKIEMPYTKAINDEVFKNKPLRPHWVKVHKKGVTFIEYHEIDKIEANHIYFKAPLVNTINPELNWQVSAVNFLNHVGVEDIYFKAHFEDDFVHHKNYIHDNAWSIVAMHKVAHSWVRRCRFSNITGAVSLSKSYASSILMLIVEGNRGHKLTNVARSTRVLSGLIHDKTNKGQWHGASMSHLTSASVIWRVNTPKQGWDSHADIPKNNLIDLYRGANITSHGGFHENEPHHLEGLTLWNYMKSGKAEPNYDFWKMSGKGYYWGFSVVNPIVVGFQSDNTTFNKASLGYLESFGKKVCPESLFEAQLKHRLGYSPKWIKRVKKQWKRLQKY